MSHLHDLFYNWKFVAFDPLPSFFVSLLPPHRATTNLSSAPKSWFLFCLDSTYQWDYTVFIFFSLTYFTEHNARKVYPCCHKWQDFFSRLIIPFCVCACTYTYGILFTYSSTDGHSGCFHVFTIANNTAKNMRVHYLFKLVFLFPLDKYPEVELLDDMVALVSIFFF